MISTKDRAKLRSIAHTYEPIVQIGKGGITDAVVDSIALVLDKRELIKIRLLQNSGLDARLACDEVCQKLGADGVQCIGSIFVIYKKSERKDINHILWFMFFCYLVFFKLTIYLSEHFLYLFLW